MFLSLFFFLVALIYSLVGFGGGTSYIALLSIYEVPYHLIPFIALLCNLIVVSGGVYHSYKKRMTPFRLVLPFIITSVPMSYFGGQISISKEIFFLILGVSLLISGFRLLFIKNKDVEILSAVPIKFAFLIGAILGLISGVLGIGGGIFLTPILLNFKWASAKQAASSASLFILLNSIFGLLGQTYKYFFKNNQIDILKDLLPYLSLFFIVFIGGQIGSRLSVNTLSPKLIRQLAAVLVIYVGGRLFVLVF